jgi:signal transduction histidine kinase
MPAYASPHPTAAASLPSMTSITKWIRHTYQAPFQDYPSSLSVRDFERFRRSVLLRIISFSVTLVLLTVSFPAVLLLQPHNDGAELASLLIVVFAGVVSLICNQRGALAAAGLIYLYGFFLSIAVYIIFTPFGLDALTIAIYGLINALLFVGGLTCPPKTLLLNCGLIIVASSLILLLTTPSHPAALGTTTSLPVLTEFLDTSYLLTTFLCWLAGRSGRVGMIRLATVLEQEQQLVALKDLFIVSANHELRTPIMTLSNNLELVARTLDVVDEQERRPMLERALRASRDLKGLLSNVLDAGISETEIRKHLHVEALSVRAVVQEALDTFDPRELGEPWLEKTTLKSRPMSLDIAPDLVMLADSGRARQVIVNLLSNALKYSENTAPIAISARLIESEGQREPGKQALPAGPWVQINVRDWGLGVPVQEQPLLFLRFVRLARDAASATRGTGVGLYLCKVLVQAMNGQIWVESTGIPGKGSVFSFALPAAQPDAAL